MSQFGVLPLGVLPVELLQELLMQMIGKRERILAISAFSGVYSHNKMKVNITRSDALDMSCQSIFPNLNGVATFHLVLIATFAVLLIPVTLISNLTLMIALIKTKRIHLSSGRFIFCISVNDMMIGLFLQPISAAAVVSTTIRQSCTAKWIIQFLSYSLLYMDACLIGGFALERLLVLKYPVMKQLTKRFQIILITSDTVLVISIGFGSIIAAKLNNFYIFNLVLLSFSAIGLLIITVIYLMAVTRVRQSVRRLSTFQSTQLHTHRKRGRTHDVALAKSVAVILFALSLCYLPFTVISFIWTICVHSGNTNYSQSIEIWLTWSFIPVFVQSSLNAYIYSYNSSTIKMYIKGVFRRLFCCFHPVGEVQPSSSGQ